MNEFLPGKQLRFFMPGFSRDFIEKFYHYDWPFHPLPGKAGRKYWASAWVNSLKLVPLESMQTKLVIFVDIGFLFDY